MKKNSYTLLLAISWLVLVTFLLCIPGKKLPTIHWFGNLQLDKLVHIVLFFILCLLVCNFFYEKNKAQTGFWFIAFLCSCYGIGMEFVQENFIDNRAFDVGDIIADIIGSFAFLVFLNLNPLYFNNK
ncbi:MAG: VanZ family protein [Chitinophagaceae bacterium]|nr:VanZ family protein [Chitinophagaceae bacterium]